MAERITSDQELEDLSSDLTEEMVGAIEAWARRNRKRVDARLPLAALLKTLLRVLRKLPPERRQASAEDFARALQRHIRPS